jgi:hypothetical protein
MLEAFTYLYIEYLLKDVDYTYYGFYNNQIFNENREEGINYEKAIFFDPKSISNTYSPDNLLRGEWEFSIHILSESNTLVRGDDKLDKISGLKYYEFVKDVLRSIDGNTTDNYIERDYNIFTDQDKYALGRIELISRDNNNDVKGVKWITLNFRTLYLDQTLWNEDVYSQLTVTGVSGEVEDGENQDYNITF